MSFFRRLWRRSQTAARLDHLEFILYTREGCHLCAAAQGRLEDARRRYHFQLITMDVDSDPVLAAEHGDWVPVVTVNGKLRFRGGVNAVLLERLLRAEMERRSSDAV
jgi:hypothetical protein